MPGLITKLLLWVLVLVSLPASAETVTTPFGAAPNTTPSSDADRGGQAVAGKDYAEALRWYRKAADQGDAYAQETLGYMYENGQGGPQNYAEAMRWYRKAAEQGEGVAQRSLGVMYAEGRGVPQDYSEAVRWWRRADEPKAQPTRTDAFSNDLRRALHHSQQLEDAEWSYAKAVRAVADQGNSWAQQRVGAMYMISKRDYAEALRAIWAGVISLAISPSDAPGGWRF